MRVTNRRALLVFFWVVVWVLAMAPRAAAGDAPSWMHALVGTTLPSYDDKTDAVLLYSETNVTVLSVDKIRTHVREAYKILRPEAREHGTISVYFNPSRKIKDLHGWCIPSQGKDYAHRGWRVGLGRKVQSAADSRAGSGKHRWLRI
jgi:hypothetical protein